MTRQAGAVAEEGQTSRRGQGARGQAGGQGARWQAGGMGRGGRARAGWGGTAARRESEGGAHGWMLGMDARGSGGMPVAARKGRQAEEWVEGKSALRNT